MKRKLQRWWWAFQYAMMTLRHKWFVFVAGWFLRVPLSRLLLHDLSKFSSKELFAYGQRFFGDKEDPRAFAEAWLHHQNHNDHHWEYWVARTAHSRQAGLDHDYDEHTGCLAMPRDAYLEMLADWLGASRAYEGKWPENCEWPWLYANWQKIKLHPQTRSDLRFLLAKLQLANYHILLDIESGVHDSPRIKLRVVHGDDQEVQDARASGN